MSKQTETIDRCVAIGMLHAAAAELLIRHGIHLYENKGCKVRHETKRAFGDLFAAYKKMQYAYDRAQELVMNNGDDNKSAMVDAFINDSGTLAMLSLLFFNATNETNPNWEQNTKNITNIMKNLTLATTDPLFPIEFVNKFAPKV